MARLGKKECGSGEDRPMSSLAIILFLVRGNLREIGKSRREEKTGKENDMNPEKTETRKKLEEKLAQQKEWLEREKKELKGILKYTKVLRRNVRESEKELLKIGLALDTLD